LLLLPGTYNFQFAAVTRNGKALANMSYQLQGAELSDPIGPMLIDTTTTPVDTNPPPPPPLFVWTSPSGLIFFYSSDSSPTDAFQ
jgi:hypothetical protein